MQATRVTVATTPTALFANTGGGRVSLLLRRPSGTTTVFLGAADVDATNGFPWSSALDAISIDLGPRDVLYGIVSAATQVVAVLRTAG